MVRTIALYGCILAGAAVFLEWLEYHYAMRTLDTNLYVVSISIIFVAIGIWVGSRLTRRKAEHRFERNEQALRALGFSAREHEVLEHLAAGHSNKEIADRLSISLNTVKTHVANVLGKLEATRRTQAIQKARELEILP